MKKCMAEHKKDLLTDTKIQRLFASVIFRVLSMIYSMNIMVIDLNYI